MSDGPFEPPFGQDDPPNLKVALHAIIEHLEDVIDEDYPRAELRRRARPLRRAIIRLRNSIEGET